MENNSEHYKFSDELEEFWRKMEDGSIFDDISQETWYKVDELVKANPNIADGI